MTLLVKAPLPGPAGCGGARGQAFEIAAAGSYPEGNQRGDRDRLGTSRPAFNDRVPGASRAVRGEGG